jgi:threonine/homoserine/homoserine lactone efflux protein
VSSGQLIGFTLVALVLIVVPGPGVLFIVGRALSHGRRTAVATATGHAAGNYVVAACVAFGLGALLQRSAEVFTAVKLAGALYLVFLGVQAIRHRHSLAVAMSAEADTREGWRALRDGVVVGMTNPKAYILFGAILPQFINRSAGHVPAQMLALALISVCMGLVSDCAWGVAASAVRTWFARSPRRFAFVGGAGGLAMIGVGVTIALTGRTDLPAGRCSASPTRRCPLPGRPAVACADRRWCVCLRLWCR